MPHTTPSPALPALSAEQTAARYALLCRATCPPDATSPAQRELHALQRVIDQQLPDLARHYCPPGFADIWLGLQAEMRRLREFCAWPALAQKTVIAFGGGFSAGKSSLINALLGHKLLPAQIDPTTSLPTCLLHGERHAIHALNRFCRLIELSPEEFASLTHDEQANWGSSTARLLEAAYVSHPAFAWQHLAFIDTPGYSKPDEAAAAQRTDAELARAWLNGAHAIVWAVSAEAGCISEEDLNFLATLNPAIPRVVAVTRADKKPQEDVAAIVALIGKTMHERQLPAEAVWAVSSRRPTHFQMPQLLDWLQQQAANPPQPARFADAVYGLYGRYAQQLKDEQARMQQRLDDCKQSIPLIENLQAANALTEEAQSLEKKLEENSRADAHLEQLTEAISKHLIAAGQTLGLDVKHMTLKAPEDRMELKFPDIPETIQANIIKIICDNNKIISCYSRRSLFICRYKFIHLAIWIHDILNSIPEDKYKLARHLRDLRNVLAIRKKGGDVHVNLVIDDASSKPETVIYAGNEYLTPIRRLLWSACRKMDYDAIRERSGVYLFLVPLKKMDDSINFNQFNSYCELIDVRGKTKEEAIEIFEAFIYYMSMQLNDSPFNVCIRLIRELQRGMNGLASKEKTAEERKQLFMQTEETRQSLVQKLISTGITPKKAEWLVRHIK